MATARSTSPSRPCSTTPIRISMRRRRWPRRLKSSCSAGRAWRAPIGPRRRTTSSRSSGRPAGGPSA
eukprot:3110218-Lingulodinium_polyedra.AAC.1